MLDETQEVMSILNGQRINEKRIYRNIYMLAKYYHEQGCDNIEIRTKIFDWGKQYGIFILIDVNSVIRKVVMETRKLTKNVVVYISDTDINEIKVRFDKYNTRLIAFAILCYCKIFANKENKEFEISLSALSNWIRIDIGHISGRYIPELIDFYYIEKVDNPAFKNRISEKYYKKVFDGKILVNIENIGYHEVTDDNFRREFEVLFEYQKDRNLQ